MKKTLTVPTSLDEVSVRQLRLYLETIQEDITDDMKTLALFQCFLGIGKRQYDAIKPADRTRIAAAMTDLLQAQAEFKAIFTYRGTRYGIIPNLEAMTNGEYIDLDNYSKKPADIPKFLSVLYRPITKQKGDYYEIEPYQGSEKLRSIMEEVPASIYLGSQAFFLTIGRELFNCTPKYLQAAAAESQQKRSASLTKNGTGKATYTHLQAGILQNLAQLLKVIF